MSAVADWAAQLAAWAIPQSILDGVSESPWTLPRAQFARRTERAISQPEGPSYARAAEALPGSVLDVGAGTGAASLPLHALATTLTVVDESEHMVEQLRRRDRVEVVVGRWPDVAPTTPGADVVVCHHVAYNVPDLDAFARELASHAYRRVVVELTAAHPLTALNPLWRRLHGLDRPEGPTATDAVAVLREAGLGPNVERWHRSQVVEYGSFDELVDLTRRRVCVPEARRDEVAAALRELGVDEEHPIDLGGSRRELVTLWWDGPKG